MPLEFPVEKFLEWLGPAAKSDMSEKLIIVTIVLWSVRGHFRKIENTLAEVGTQVGNLAKALTSVEEKHSSRIGALEEKVRKLEKP